MNKDHLDQENKDHLDQETSISAELTPTGITAKAKSRAIAAFDRLIGSALDRLAAPMEVRTNEVRASGESRLKIQAALTERKIELIGREDEYVVAALELDLGGAVRRLDNKAAVVKAAIEDLRLNPPTEAEGEAGPETINPDFINKFERCAEDASSEEMRIRWAKVLSSEIRTPGTFSSKTLRVIDELDTSTAESFEYLSNNRFNKYVPICLIADMPYVDRQKLVSAGLIHVIGPTGDSVGFGKWDLESSPWWAMYFGKRLVAISFKSETPKNSRAYDGKPICFDSNKVPGLPIYTLTDVGISISTIIGSNEDDVGSRYFEAVSSYLDDAVVREYYEGEKGYIFVREVVR